LAEPLVSLKDTSTLMDRLHQKDALDKFMQKGFFNEADGTL
jgi:hypothetical protein